MSFSIIAYAVLILRIGKVFGDGLAIEILQTLFFSLMRNRDTARTAVNLEAHYSWALTLLDTKCERSNIICYCKGMAEDEGLFLFIQLS